jgi:2-polyprenyl-3-methyl-5-hydroxy-6-metoxy-1,4-benzoquinol methylase
VKNFASALSSSDMDEAEIQIEREEGIVSIRKQDDDKQLLVTLVPRSPALYIPRKSCKTTFSLEMVKFLLQRSDFAWLCDNLARHDDSVPSVLKHQLFSYFTPEDLQGKRLLDFGCGSGASTLALAKMLPRTQIVGVELGADKIETANRIKAFRSAGNVEFFCSPSGGELPPEVGKFDFVMLSAVYEHLLPQERRTVMPLIWSVMKLGAAILINQTPYRYSPYEAHSTGLWFINYFPDKLTHFLVRHFAGRNPRINKSPDWNVHLRGGLRGGTEKEIILNLTGACPANARVLQPRQNGVRDRADLWLSSTSRRHWTLKRMIASGFRFSDQLWGTIPNLNLEVVIQKLY